MTSGLKFFPYTSPTYTLMRPVVMAGLWEQHGALQQRASRHIAAASLGNRQGQSMGSTHLSTRHGGPSSKQASTAASLPASTQPTRLGSSRQGKEILLGDAPQTLSLARASMQRKERRSRPPSIVRFGGFNLMHCKSASPPSGGDQRKELVASEQDTDFGTRGSSLRGHPRSRIVLRGVDSDLPCLCRNKSDTRCKGKPAGAVLMLGARLGAARGICSPVLARSVAVIGRLGRFYVT